MKFELIGYDIADGEVLTGSGAWVQTGPKTWTLEPTQDGIYELEITSSTKGIISTTQHLSLLEVLSLQNNMLISSVDQTEKEEVIEADIRSIISSFALEQYNEAAVKITSAREAWII